MKTISFCLGACVALMALGCSNARDIEDDFEYAYAEDADLEYDDVWEPFSAAELGENNFTAINAAAGEHFRFSDQMHPQTGW